jgi:hypothetical protein
VVYKFEFNDKRHREELGDLKVTLHASNTGILYAEESIKGEKNIGHLCGYR